MICNTDFLIRDWNPDDLPFIFDSWLDSYAIACADMSPKVYRKCHHKLIENQIEGGAVTLKIACNPHDKTHIFGWICANKDCLHFVYVKSAMRSFGIGKALLKEIPILTEYSHRTRSISHLKIKDAFYNPYRFFL